MTANIAIADSLKALDFNRPNREEPSQTHDHRQTRLLRRRPAQAHAESRASPAQGSQQSRGKLARSHSQTRAGNAKVSIMERTSNIRRNLLRGPQSFRSHSITSLRIRHPSASPLGDGGVEIRHMCSRVKPAARDYSRPVLVNVTSPEPFLKMAALKRGLRPRLVVSPVVPRLRGLKLYVEEPMPRTSVVPESCAPRLLSNIVPQQLQYNSIKNAKPKLATYCLPLRLVA